MKNGEAKPLAGKRKAREGGRGGEIEAGGRLYCQSQSNNKKSEETSRPAKPSRVQEET